MSQENVEIARRAFEAFNRSDYEGTLALFDPDAEWHPFLGALEGRIYRGRAALLQMWNELNENLGGRLRLEVKELIDRGDRVVSVVEAHGIGTASGAEVRQSWAQVISIRDGLRLSRRALPGQGGRARSRGGRESLARVARAAGARVWVFAVPTARGTDQLAVATKSRPTAA